MRKCWEWCLGRLKRMFIDNNSSRLNVAYDGRNGYFQDSTVMSIFDELQNFPDSTIDEHPFIIIKTKVVVNNIKTHELYLKDIRGLFNRSREIHTIPNKIVYLFNLRTLDLGNNPIYALPHDIGNLGNLKYLILPSTRIKELPQSIGKLRNLQFLDLNNTRIYKLPQSIGSLNKLRTLYLNNTKIDMLPRGFENLYALEYIGLSNTPISHLPQSICNLSNLQVLYLDNTMIRELPYNFGNLSSLKHLSLSGTRICQLPKSIGKLSNLQGLELHDTQISELPESISNLSKLRNLDLHDSLIHTLPQCFENLKELSYLDLYNTRISELPCHINMLNRLKRLDLHDSPISKLPTGLGDLHCLEYLDLHNTNISKLPQFLENLSNLEYLDLHNTQISELPSSIGNLKKLKYLDLSNTKITKLPESIGNLYNLQGLNLAKTGIKILPKSIGSLSSLKILDLSELELINIDKSVLLLNLSFVFLSKSLVFHDLYNESNAANGKIGININGLSLIKQPVSLFHQDISLIKQYFDEDMILVNSAKVILLGDGGVGKTYSIKRLINDGRKETEDNRYPTKTTHGVLIRSYSVHEGDQKITIKFWDFGGQHIMHSMHRCFLTERTCYLVVLSTRTDHHHSLMEQARYWLRTINSFAPSSQIIIFVNQWTENHLTLDEKRLIEEGYHNIKKVLHFSAVNSEDNEFLTLRDALIDQIHNLDSYGMEFPKSWYGVMHALEYESSSYISKTRYHRLCYDNGLKYSEKNEEDEESIYDWLLDWFNDLGICFSYHKNTNSMRLADYTLLNPQWLTRAAYVLITKGERESDNGILTKEQIENLLIKTAPLDYDDELGIITYDSNHIEFILEILRKFWISYRLPGNRELIPILCDDQSFGRRAPDWYDSSNEVFHHTAYELAYTYLPKAIVHRLMIFCYKCHYNVKYRWRRGMVVNFDELSGLTAVIDAGGVRQSITIDIYSDGHIPCWTFLQKFRAEILLINKEMNLKTDDYIIMITNGIKDRFSVKDILKQRSKKATVVWASNYGDFYKISDVLGSAYGWTNASIIENLACTGKDINHTDILSDIFKLHEQVLNAISSVAEKNMELQILLYLTKDQITEYHSETRKNQEIILAMLKTINRSPSVLQSLTKKLLSGISITADLLALVQVANPDLILEMQETVSEALIYILPRLFSS